MPALGQALSLRFPFRRDTGGRRLLRTRLPGPSHTSSIPSQRDGWPMVSTTAHGCLPPPTCPPGSFTFWGYSRSFWVPPKPIWWRFVAYLRRHQDPPAFFCFSLTQRRREWTAESRNAAPARRQQPRQPHVSSTAMPQPLPDIALQQRNRSSDSGRKAFFRAPAGTSSKIISGREAEFRKTLIY